MERGKRILLYFCILFLLGLVVAVSQGCSCKNTETTKTVVSTDVVKVNIPVACQFPKVVCDFGGEGFVPTEKLLDCVIIQKRLMEACSAENNTTTE